MSRVMLRIDDTNVRSRECRVTKSFEATALGRKDASGQIATQIRRAISEGLWEPGERLPTEQEFADTFDVSRATAREALKLLSATGLVATSRGSNGGTYVTAPNAGDVAAQLSDAIQIWYRAGNVSLRDVDEARWVLEMHCVDLAARRRTDDDLTRMLDPIERSRDATMDMADWLDLDLDFHTAVTKAAKNPILELAMTSVHLARPATNTVFVGLLDRDLVCDQHFDIYAAIRDGDPDRAQEAFKAHVTYLDQTRREALADADASEVLVASLPRVEHSGAERPA